MSASRGSEDLYSIVSAHYNLLSSRSKEKQQSATGTEIQPKRGLPRPFGNHLICSEFGMASPLVNPQLQLENQGPLSSNCFQREVHIWTERTRRKKMSYMFNSLLSLLPGVHRKVDKTRIISEAINYIKTLQATLKDLQARKLEIEASAKTRSSTMTKLEKSLQAFDIEVPLSVPMVSYAGVKILGSNVVGTHAFTTISAPQQSGFLSKFFSILDANQLEIVDGTINNVGCNEIYTFHLMSESNDQQSTEKAFRCAINSIISTHED